MAHQFGQRGYDRGLIITLDTVGPKGIPWGDNVLGLVGTASGGPAMTPLRFTSSRTSTATWLGGDLRDGCELGFQQGVPEVIGIRVLGVGYDSATVDVEDGGGNEIGTFTARSAGIPGNSISVEVELGSYPTWDVERFKGENRTGPYYLKFRDCKEDDDNWCMVGNVVHEVVYQLEDLVSGKVLLDTTLGSLTFHSSDKPQDYQEIQCRIAYETRRVIVKDGELMPHSYDNVHDLIALEAFLINDTRASFEANALETHLPAVGVYPLIGGSDGLAVTKDDYQTALELLMDYTLKVKHFLTAVALCAYECEANTYDLLPKAAGWCSMMENVFAPCLVFCAMRENETEALAFKEVSSYNHRNFSLVFNPWDNTRPVRLNGAVARAATEASLPLGESAAYHQHAINGLDGLLNEYLMDTADVMNKNRIDCLIKGDAGILPYWGRSTAFEREFWSCVDNRTINTIIKAIKWITDQYYFAKNTPDNREDIRKALIAFLAELRSYEIVNKYTVEVEPSLYDRDKVFIHLQVENVGHMAVFDVKYDTGNLPEVKM